MSFTDAEYHVLLDSLHDGVYFVDRERRIQFWNKAAEQITGFSSESVVGQCCSSAILTHVDANGDSLCQGLCPLARTLVDGQPREDHVFLHHKDGHRLPVSIRITPMHDAAGNITGAAEVFVSPASRAVDEHRVQELERLAMFDALTQLANRHYVNIELHNRLEEMKRYGWSFGVFLADLDHFKSVNDAHGHDVGDAVLRAVARTMTANARPFDVIGRWGGEEFIGIIRNVGADGLRATAERIRRLVGSCYVSVPGGAVRVTISMGATLAHAEDTPETLVKRADLLLYRSKQSGRNKVTAAGTHEANGTTQRDPA
jgi:diguanylate cyclase (GGDEF)-like protein/PAS domain S-box-containing protein